MKLQIHSRITEPSWEESDSPHKGPVLRKMLPFPSCLHALPLLQTFVNAANKIPGWLTFVYITRIYSAIYRPCSCWWQNYHNRCHCGSDQGIFWHQDTGSWHIMQLTRLYLPEINLSLELHNDVIKRKHFPRHWPLVNAIHRSPVDSPYKGQWSGALMFSLICAWTNSWANKRDAGDLRRHRAHYDVTVM